MHGVMDRVEVILLGQLGQLNLAFGRAVLGIHTHFKILLGGVGHDLAQQLGELRRMLSLFIGGLLPVEADFRIALAMRDARHRQIHTNLAALAREVRTQAVDDLLRAALSYADHMLSRPGALALLLDKLARRHAALRALLRRVLAFPNITANRANPLFHNRFLLFFVVFVEPPKTVERSAFVG